MSKISLENDNARIEEVDELLICLLAYRRVVCLTIGALKEANGEQTYRPEVEDLRIKRGEEFGETIGLNRHFVHSMMYPIINECYKQQAIQRQGGKLPYVNVNVVYQLLRQNLARLAGRIAVK